MNIFLAAGFIGGWELVLILAVVLVLFGAKKLPELAKGLGQGIKEFKKATRDVQDELHNAMEETPKRYIEPPQAVPPAATAQNTASAPANTAPQPKVS
jgi:sec-independent protein translocase protein TatA